MSHPLTICLHRGTSLIGRLIRWQTRSAYSHASIVTPDGWFIEAREGIGVRALSLLPNQPIPAAKGEQVDKFHIEATHAQVRAIVAFARAQTGKPYDYTMVARFVSRRAESRASAGKWFCSELVYAALQAAGLEPLRATQPWEVSPGLLARSPLLQPVSP